MLQTLSKIEVVNINYFLVGWDLPLTPFLPPQWLRPCLVNRNNRTLVVCPELLVRKWVDSGIEPAGCYKVSRYPKLENIATTTLH